MMRALSITVYLLISLFTSATVFANTPLENLLASAERSTEDKAADKKRHPQKFIEFLDIQPGMTVLDVFSGGGYYSEILSTVVGPQGQVDAHNNDAYVEYIGADKLAARYQNNRLANVKRLNQEANRLNLTQGKYDRILLVLSFHDLYYADPDSGWPKIAPSPFMLQLKQALKPGGMIGIIDHNAKSGSSIDTAQTLHRIDPAKIKKDMQGWGFELVAEQKYLANNDDPLDIPMWDESIRGKTDRSVLKFRIAR